MGRGCVGLWGLFCWDGIGRLGDGGWGEVFFFLLRMRGCSEEELEKRNGSSVATCSAQRSSLGSAMRRKSNLQEYVREEELSEYGTVHFSKELCYGLRGRSAMISQKGWYELLLYFTCWGALRAELRWTLILAFVASNQIDPGGRSTLFLY